MTIDTYNISEDQLFRIFQIQEGHFNDLKRKEITPAKLSRTISAFANSDGGEIYLGIGENKNSDGSKTRFWQGFQDIEDYNGHIQSIHNIFPFDQYIDLAFLKANGQKGFVLQITIHKTKEILYATDKKAYIRKGAQNIPIDSHEGLKRLEFDKGITSYEQQVLNIPKDIVIESSVTKEFINEVIPSTDPESWLKKQLLIQNEKPTVASVLLFAEEPQVALPKQSGIKIYRYKTKDKEGTRQTLAFDPITIEGDIYSQIQTAVEKTVEIVHSIKYLGDKGFELINYPKEAIHEIVTNAVLHRDYSKKSDIHIAIFDNRIEIVSPGKLPGHITPSNILEEQLARNGAVVRIVNKFPNPPNKDVGEGLNTAFLAMRNLRLKEPEIVETDAGVKVTIHHEALASPEEIVMHYLQANSEISNSIARNLCGINSENEMKRVFQKLQSSGMLERTPNKKGSASTWRKPEKKQPPHGDQLKLF